LFSFEKENQKTFIRFRDQAPAGDSDRPFAGPRRCKVPKTEKSLFASFSSEKEVFSFLF